MTMPVQAAEAGQMREASRGAGGEAVPGRDATRPRLDARGVVRHARRRWMQILVCGVAVAAAAQGALAQIPRSYTSTIRLLVDPAGIQVLDGDIVDRTPRYDSGVSLIESQARVIRSDSVLRPVVGALDLGRDPEFTVAGWLDRTAARISGALGLDPPAADPTEIAVEALRQRMMVRRPELTLIIDVSVETHEPDKSARIANAVADAFLEAEAANRSQTAQRLSGSFSEGLDALKASVGDVEARIVRYRLENGIVTSAGLPLNDWQLQALNRRASAAGLETARARERLEQAASARTDDAAALPEMLQSDGLRRLRQRYAEISGSMAALAARLGARHPAVAEQAEQLQALRRQFQGEKDRVVEGLRKEYERAAASEAAIRGGLASTASDVAGTDRAAVGLRELDRELAARRSVYEAYLRRSREIGQQAWVDSARIRIISPAAPSGRPSWPPPRWTVLVQSFGIGLVAGLWLALARGVRRDRRAA